jgi:hypothetical protein
MNLHLYDTIRHDITCHDTSEIGIDSKHEQSWNIGDFYGQIDDDFMLSSFEKMMPFIKNIHSNQKLPIMNFIIYFDSVKLLKTKIGKIKKVVLSFLNYESMAPNVKSKMFVSKQIIYKGLRESKVVQLWKKPSRIEKHTLS